MIYLLLSSNIYIYYFYTAKSAIDPGLDDIKKEISVSKFVTCLLSIYLLLFLFTIIAIIT